MTNFLNRSKCKKEYQSIHNKIEVTAKVANLPVEVGVKKHPQMLISPSTYAKSIDNFQYEECLQAERASKEKKEDIKDYHLKKRKAGLDSVSNLELMLEASVKNGKLDKILNEKLTKIFEQIDTILSLSFKELQATTIFQNLNVDSRSGIRRSPNL